MLLHENLKTFQTPPPLGMLPLPPFSILWHASLSGGGGGGRSYVSLQRESVSEGLLRLRLLRLLPCFTLLLLGRSQVHPSIHSASESDTLKAPRLPFGHLVLFWGKLRIMRMIYHFLANYFLSSFDIRL